MPRFSTHRIKGMATVLGVAVGVTALLGAQDAEIEPSQADRITARIVAELIERAHLSKPKIDDEISARWHKKYIESLDRGKLFFTKADIEEFEPFKDQLDDQIRRGDLSFALFVFERFLTRLDERFEVINELLDAGFDFDAEETYIDDPDALDYPVDAEEARERWRKELKYQLLVQMLGDTDYDEAVRRLKIRYKDNLYRYFHQFEMLELKEYYLSALSQSVDPHSEYMGWKNLEDMMSQQLQLSLEGIGASLTMEDGLPVIKEIIPGGAAAKDGRLKPEDKILAVEKEDGELIDFYEKKISDVVRVIRGPRGTDVKLIVQPAGTKARETYVITREKIELADQHAKGEVIETKAPDGTPLKIGVINLPSFYGDTAAVRRGDKDAVSATADCRRLLEEFKGQDVDCVLIDLRGNGGGLLLEAISLSGLFIDTGPVVRVRDADGVLPYNDEDAGTAYDGPLAVLISHTSASASEIFAGVIKDYGRGLIIGDSSTFGKGTVQSIIDLNNWLSNPAGFPNLGALRLTIQQFYRANGMSTQVRGVTPDVHIPSVADHIQQLGEGEMDNALAFDKIDDLPHDHYNRVPAELVSLLTERSLERRRTSEKFQKQSEAIQKFIERQNRKELPLNKEKFFAEFQKDEDDEVDELMDQPEAIASGRAGEEKKVWNTDSFYNEEVLKIVGDYVTLGAEVVASAPVRAGDRHNN
ncbi:carboxy terminal-processing peptidase [Tautonia sociabilis]|uniref:Tail-specific protease n=1 Tax=Tautonia sociabilis TaxID=2080755 RepID=A0A432ML56_9BACT|nr:carboxy terminal-processing peptidase [Tautonia sociabilis]RUL88141.1 tail-specific protease [Tautonia sociabilis]